MVATTNKFYFRRKSHFSFVPESSLRYFLRNRQIYHKVNFGKGNRNSLLLEQTQPYRKPGQQFCGALYSAISVFLFMLQYNTTQRLFPTDILFITLCTDIVKSNVYCLTQDETVLPTDLHREGTVFYPHATAYNRQ